jgi:hypothetical protein
MEVLDIILGFSPVIICVVTIWQVIARRRPKDGYTVDGRITYLEGKTAGLPLLTFSYSVGGSRFHKSWADTLDRGDDYKLREAAVRFSVGDTVSVWCARKNPEACRIVLPEEWKASPDSLAAIEKVRIPEYRVKMYSTFGLLVSVPLTFDTFKDVSKAWADLQFVWNTGSRREPFLQTLGWAHQPLEFGIYFSHDLLVLIVAALVSTGLIWRIVRGRGAFGRWF